MVKLRKSGSQLKKVFDGLLPDKEIYLGYNAYFKYPFDKYLCLDSHLNIGFSFVIENKRVSDAD
jgi:hypothetical protein